MLQLRQRALGDARRVARTRRWRGRPLRAALAAAAILAFAFYWAANLYYGADIYSTVATERRVVTLDDGSRMFLDGRSRVRVDYTKQARNLEVLEGQARFDVAHDVEHPFIVTARDRKIIATGTAFGVDVQGSTVLVTLLEGSVTVIDTETGGTASEMAAAPVVLRPGEQMAAAPASRAQVKKVDIARATAWERGQLVFEDEPLRTVVERINRYARTPVTVADDKVGNLRISGVFNTGDVTAFIDAVTRYLPIKAVRTGDRAISLRADS